MHEERLRRLREQGLLTPEQEDRLRESLQPLSPERGVGMRRMPRRKWWPALVVLLGAILAGLVWGFLVGGEVTAPQDVSAILNIEGGTGSMNRWTGTLLGMLLFLVLPLVVWTLLYNSLVGKEERVLEAWAQVETSYQRRSDLVPALVETVSRYLRHERETLERVTEERSEGLSGLQAMTEDLVQAQQRSAELLREHAGQPPEDEEALLALSQAQAQVGAQMRRFFGLTESYPQLRSADQFLRLQAQLEGTENRINVARSRFNESVRDFNRSIRALPGSLVAAAGDFRRKAYFRADEESHQVPVLGY